MQANLSANKFSFHHSHTTETEHDTSDKTRKLYWLDRLTKWRKGSGRPLTAFPACRSPRLTSHSAKTF